VWEKQDTGGIDRCWLRAVVMIVVVVVVVVVGVSSISRD
jgi:hypothetical protein